MATTPAVALFLGTLFAVPGLILAQPAPDSIFTGAAADLRASRYVEAEAKFRQLMELEPEGIRAFLGVAQVYVAQKQQAAALRFLQEQSGKQPLRLDLHVAAGDAALAAKQVDVAVTEYSGVLKMLDGRANAELYVPRGAGFLDGRDATPKGAAGIHTRLGEAFGLKGDQAAAAVEWRAAADLLPRAAWVLTNLAVALETSGSKIEAQKAYRAALALEPSNAVTLNNLAFLIADTRGDLNEALRFARKANLLAPGSPDILDTVGWISLQQGFVDDALGNFRRALQKRPESSDFRRHLTAALMQRPRRSPEEEALLQALQAGDQDRIVSLLDRK